MHDKAAFEFVDDSRDTLLSLCADLVAAKSVNPPGDVTAPAEVLRRFLESHDVPVEIAAATPDKPNLVASFDGTGAGPHLIFNGHLDTLSPGDGAAWTVPLFEMTRRGERLTGLGIGNMKAGTAGLALATVFLHRNKTLWCGRLTMTAVADETVFGPDGAAWLLGARPELLGDALICGEGPGLRGMAIAEKGLLWIEVEARAAPGQGMINRRGSSAVARLASVVTAIDALNEEHAAPPADAAILADRAGEHGLKISTNCGTIAGGHFVSQLATRAAAQIDIRIPPGLTQADIGARIDAIVASAPDTSWRRLKGWDPNWTPPDAEICRCVESAAEAVCGASPALVVRLPASDASRWRSRGIPAVCYGPQATLAAGVDDYVLESDVIDCCKVYASAALLYLSRDR